MSKKGVRDRTKYLAKLVTENRKPCAFCQREVDDEITYGKLYSIGDIQCHYFCVLLSCCLVQKGKDEDGLFGFLYPDILAEIERSKKHRCSYCGKDGATLGCGISQCRKQFHLPCGREKNAVSLFFGNYKSFCKNHAPKQKVTDNVMAKVKQRRWAKNSNKAASIKEAVVVADEDSLKAETVCVICYEEVDCFPSPETFWPPCCARDAWFHRSCVQRMSLSAGMHYLKCPLCNDKETFYQAVIGQGFYVPDRDAAWELEQNAFAEIYQRELRCGLDHCACAAGRDHDAEAGPWDIKLCLLCGSVGAHAQCLLESGCTQPWYICATCAPAAPADLDQLATSIENVILAEQARAAPGSRRRVMPSRMSLRRTKQRQANRSLGSSSQSCTSCNVPEQASTNTTASREDLNLKPPKRPSTSETVLKDIENKLFSPVKMIERGLREKVKAENLVLEPSLVEQVRLRFRKPKPLSEKKKIVDGILEDLVNNILKENPKVKEPVRAWCSPKKEFIEAEQEKQIGDPEAPIQRTIDIKQESTEVGPSEMVDTPHESLVIKSEVITEETVETKSDQPNACIDFGKESASHQEESIQNDYCLAVVDISSDDMNTELQNTGANESFSPNITKTEDDVTVVSDDESSNSTFQLPPEFVAEDSDNSLPIFDTPKKLKTVEMQKDSSMEISEDNDIVNIDLVKIENGDADVTENVNVPIKIEKCAFKFSPTNKEALHSNNMDIDLKSFKNQYLNEVNRDFKCNFSPKHKEKTSNSVQLKTSLDFAIDAVKTENRKSKSSKRKAKKRRMSGIVLQYENVDNNPKRKRKNMDAEVSIQNESMKVKISLKKKKFKLKIMQAKVENTPKSLKQYVLKYSDGSPNEMIGKPEKEVSPMKRKYIKQEKSSDNLVQTSIQSFFKEKSPKES